MTVNKKNNKEREPTELWTDHRVKLKEGKKKDKYMDLAREPKNLWNIKVVVIPTVIGALVSVTKGLILGLEELEKKKDDWWPKDSLIKMKQNTKKNPGELKRLAVASTPMRNHQLMLVRKTLKWVKW